jgi:hypothetical protein
MMEHFSYDKQGQTNTNYFRNSVLCESYFRRANWLSCIPLPTYILGCMGRNYQLVNGQMIFKEPKSMSEKSRHSSANSGF